MVHFCVPCVLLVEHGECTYIQIRSMHAHSQQFDCAGASMLAVKESLFCKSGRHVIM